MGPARYGMKWTLAHGGPSKVGAGGCPTGTHIWTTIVESWAQYCVSLSISSTLFCKLVFVMFWRLPHGLAIVFAPHDHLEV